MNQLKRPLIYASVSLISNLCLYLYGSSLLSHVLDCYVAEEQWTGVNLLLLGFLIISLSVSLWGFLFAGLRIEFQKWNCPFWFFLIYLIIATIFAIINVLCGCDCIWMWNLFK